jgi:hypothetical protein
MNNSIQTPENECTVNLTIGEVHFMKNALSRQIERFQKGLEDLDAEQQEYIKTIIDIHNNLLNKLGV